MSRIALSNRQDTPKANIGHPKYLYTIFSSRTLPSQATAPSQPDLRGHPPMGWLCSEQLHRRAGLAAKLEDFRVGSHCMVTKCCLCSCQDGCRNRYSDCNLSVGRRVVGCWRFLQGVHDGCSISLLHACQFACGLVVHFAWWLASAFG